MFVAYAKACASEQILRVVLLKTKRVLSFRDGLEGVAVKFNPATAFGNMVKQKVANASAKTDTVDLHSQCVNGFRGCICGRRAWMIFLRLSSGGVPRGVAHLRRARGMGHPVRQPGARAKILSMFSLAGCGTSDLTANDRSETIIHALLGYQWHWRHR